MSLSFFPATPNTIRKERESQSRLLQCFLKAEETDCDDGSASVCPPFRRMGTHKLHNERTSGRRDREREREGREGGRDEGTKAAATALARSLVRAAADATAILARLSRLGGEDELVPGTFLNYRIS